MNKNKFKKASILLIAIVIMVAATSTAFATDISNQVYWNSTVCQNQFTTSKYTTKTSGNWDNAEVNAYTIIFSPDIPSGDYVKLEAIVKSTSGTIMGPAEDIYQSSSSYYQPDITGNKGTASFKLLISNPYSGRNMESHGRFYGLYD